MEEALVKFARHTRHTERELNDARNLLARKYIVVHLATTAPEEAYHHVAADYNWVARRTRDPPLSAYREHEMIDAPALVEIMRDGWKRNEPVDRNDPALPTLGAFCDAIFPIDAEEESWKPYRRSNHWVQRATFALAHRLDHPHARAALGTVLRADDSPEFTHYTETQHQLRADDAWDRITSYVKEVSGGNLETSPAEWGKFLDGLNQLDDGDVFLPLRFNAASNDDADMEVDNVADASGALLAAGKGDIEAPRAKAVIRSDVEPPRTRTIDQWAADSAHVRQWRLENALSPATPPAAAARAYLLQEPLCELASQVLADHATAEHVSHALPLLEVGREYTPAEVVAHEACAQNMEVRIEMLRKVLE